MADGHDPFTQIEDRDTLVAAVRQLPPRQRAVVTLRHVGGTCSSSPQDFGGDGQPQVTIDLEMVIDEVVSAIPPLAPGLLQLHPWLAPAR